MQKLSQEEDGEMREGVVRGADIISGESPSSPGEPVTPNFGLQLTRIWEISWQFLDIFV